MKMFGSMTWNECEILIIVYPICFYAHSLGNSIELYEKESSVFNLVQLKNLNIRQKRKRVFI
jgi:hypothetical protein